MPLKKIVERTDPPQHYILDKNREYVVGLSEQKFPQYEQVIKHLHHCIQDGVYKTKQEVHDAMEKKIDAVLASQ